MFNPGPKRAKVNKKPATATVTSAAATLSHSHPAPPNHWRLHCTLPAPDDSYLLLIQPYRVSYLRYINDQTVEGPNYCTLYIPELLLLTVVCVYPFHRPCLL